MSLGKRLFIGGDTGIDGTEDFAPKLYTGNGAAGHSITGVGFQPDLVWIKQRSTPDTSNFLFDVVRGTSNWLSSNLNFAENSDSGVTSFDSDGFTLGSNSSMNGSSKTYVAWCWKAGGTAVSNTTGTLTSTVSANPDAGFSIVKWTGNDTANATIGHGLSTAPKLYIIKKTSAAANWQVNLASSVTGTEGYLNLDGSASIYTTFPNYYTSANSTVLSTNGTTTGERVYNNQSADYVAYCFHDVTGYQKIGSYSGDGSSSNSITTGFEPRFVLIRRTDATANWRILDSGRSTSNPRNKELYPNLSNSEGTFSAANFNSTGFEIITADASYNNSSGTYLYLAIA